MAKTQKGSDASIIVNQLTINQVNRQAMDIGKFKDALKSAESITNPNRTLLYDMYTNALLDAHLKAVIQKRKLPILNSKLQLNTKNTKLKEVIEKYTNTIEFDLLLHYILDTRYWGHTLIEVIPLDTENMKFEYSLIPRKHVKADKGIVVKTSTDTEGIDYVNGNYNIIEIADIENLGLLSAATPYVVYKRNGFGDFAQYTELYGTPIREGVYDGHDEIAREALKRDLTEMGSAGVFVHPEGTRINFIESKSQSGSSDLYDKLITICNNEISKLILGNTLTTEVGSNGGNRSLGETMKESELDLINADKKMLINVLNSQLIPLFQKFGIAIDGEFSFVENINLRDKIDLDIKINSACPIEPSYFEETYGVPIMKKQANAQDSKKLFFLRNEKLFFEKLYHLFS